MNWNDAIERTVKGLGYALVDCERAPRGLLRVYIDRLEGATYESGAEFVTVDDCEKVTRQLQHVLEVEGCDYQRLEVSSPGLDRPLKSATDYARFSGHEIDLTLKLPFQGRKKFRGLLEPAGEGWRITFNDGKVEQALGFELGEVREARLVPVVNFKGRAAAAARPELAGTAATQEMDGGHEE
jgi:ribosome maturation factor RimP